MKRIGDLEILKDLPHRHASGWSGAAHKRCWKPGGSITVVPDRKS